MKNISYYLSCLFIITSILSSCDDTEELDNSIESLEAPSELAMAFNITQDNTGLVTITPNSRGASRYEVFYGDGTTTSVNLKLGESTQHIYREGSYTVRLLAYGINNKVTEYTQNLMVSFRAPENLVITTTINPNNNLSVIVKATASFATMFDVTFGENPALPAQPLSAGGETSYTYSNTGTYIITVTAYSGGTATTTGTQNIVIRDPFLLPIDFESTTLLYESIDFGGAASAKVANPDPIVNSSANVFRVRKTSGAEFFAGSILELDAPIDFSTFQKLRVDTWSPLPAGTIVKLKLENATDPNINTEVDAATTVRNGWETLVFDFSTANLTQSYSKIIIFFDFGNVGNNNTFYFDNIFLTNRSAQSLALPLTFESPLLTYNFIEFGGAPTAVVANPSATGLNTSANVARTLKVSGAQTFAGAFIDLDNPINFGAFSKIKIKVYSPRAGRVVRLKIENISNSNIFREVDATTTVANAWQELVYDLPGVLTADNYQRLVFFFDFGNTGQGENYYFDDVSLTN